jgi:spermidine synthase
MNPRVLLGTAPIPGTGAEMRLYRTGELFSITIPGRGDLMTSRLHGSERALAELTCERLHKADPRLLIGGLGMGYTLAAALGAVGPGAEIVIAELVPEVVAWNREFLTELCGDPLADPRTTVLVGDVAQPIREQRQGFDAILLDVDNGPEGLVRRDNDWLYSVDGLRAAHAALRPKGILAVWSVSPDRRFSKRLQQAGFAVEEIVVRGHRPGKGPRHHLWIARLPG